MTKAILLDADTTDSEAVAPQFAPANAVETRRALLTSARRSMVPIRYILLQQPSTAVVRSSHLAYLVRHRQERALDALLMLLAMYPILRNDPLPSTVWARLLSPELGPLVSAPGMSKTWTVLEDQGLARRGKRIRRMVDIQPLHESGDGREYTSPGLDAKGTSKGYFWLPNEYWLDGWHEELSLPGKAMLLIWLSATSQQPSFDMSYEQSPRWYGVSERSAERGIRELINHGLMKESVTKVQAPRLATGYTYRHNRYLTGPFSTDNRRAAHAQMVKEARARAGKKSATNAGGGESDGN